MQEIVEVENFNYYTTEELFYYLLDNLVIPPDEEFKQWKYYKQDMIRLCEEYYDKYYGEGRKD
jgi:hypothetical protein